MKKKVLMVATVVSNIYQFSMLNIVVLKKLGYDVEIACSFGKNNALSVEKINSIKSEFNNMGVKFYDLSIERNPIHFIKNIRALFHLIDLCKINKYSFMHCHTPIGAVLSRLTAKITETKVIYTAHGFHFFKNAPLINWLFYYPIEKLLSYYTDALITINSEDYNFSLSHFKHPKVYYVPGIGIDLKYIENIDACNGDVIENDSNVIKLVSVGELNNNKNHSLIIKSLSDINDYNLKYYIIGTGSKYNELAELIKKLKLENKVFLLGYRTDVISCVKKCDFFVFPSKREGLSVALMEAMTCGKPCIVSKIRGNVDLIDEEKGGFFFDPNSCESFIDSFKKLINHKCFDIREMGIYNKNKILKFCDKIIENKLFEIYDSI